MAASPASSTHRDFDERFAKALSHPLRQRILRHLGADGVASPNELSQTLGDPLGNVSYHVRILRELDCIELVRTEQRRGAIEHYYRAVERPWLEDGRWAELPAAFRRRTLGRTLGELFAAASEWSGKGGFDHPETHVTRLELELDGQGWEEMCQLLTDTLEAAQRIQAESASRSAKAGSNGIVPTELALVHFRRQSADA